MTHALVNVALALLDQPRAHQHYGYDLCRRSGVRSGVLYPILTRLLKEGWIRDGWEDPTDAIKRPPRRYYEVTDDGYRELTAVLHRAGTDARFRHLDLGWT